MENDKFNINHLFTVTSGNTVYAYMLNAVHSENLKVTLLHFAIVNGHLKIAKVLLNKGAGVNEKDSHGNTSLHCAALHGDSDIVQILLNNGADVNKKAFMGETALHSAALSGHSDVVQALLNNGANVNEKKHTWQHCLTFNCYTGPTRSSASSTKQRG